MDDSLDDWFAREILVHEGALESFLRRAWPNRDEIHDLRQEAYVRVYEAAARSRPTTPRAFLFPTDRHLVTDRRHRGRVASLTQAGVPAGLNGWFDVGSPNRRPGP